MVQRKYTACVECGESREIAAHGLCFVCYHRQRRTDVRSPQYGKQTARAAYALQGRVFAMLNTTDEDERAILAVLRPYLAAVWPEWHDT